MESRPPIAKLKLMKRMKPLSGPLGAVLISLAVGGCANDARADQPRIERTDDALVFDGRITQEAVSTLIGMLTRDDTLLIESKGGDPRAALALARHLQRNRVALQVNGECEAECASYLFVLAPIRHAVVGGSVRYGLSPFSQQRGAMRDEAMLSEYTQALARAGVSKSLIDCVDTHLSGRPHRVKAAISREILAQHGVTVQGAYVWPADEEYRERYQDFSPGLVWIDDPDACPQKALTPLPLKVS